MNPALIVSAVGVGCFVAGVVFSKAVLTETASIKEHVTAAETRIRGDISSLLNKAATKV
jgi:hypothetical protein